MKTPLEFVPVQEAVQPVQSGNRVFIQGAAMTPAYLVEALCERNRELQDVELVHVHTEGPALYSQPPYQDSFMINSFFVGGNVRKAVNTRQGDYIPIFLSEIHLLFKRNILPLDFAFIQVSPPDKHGFCSLGTSVDVALQAIKSAKTVVAQVNPQVPRTHGEGMIHCSMIDYAVEVDCPIFGHELKVPTEIEQKIGKHIAGLIEDGATLQMGIGGIPNAVLYELQNHKGLGIHTEMFSNRGTATDRKRHHHRGTQSRGPRKNCLLFHNGK